MICPLCRTIHTNAAGDPRCLDCRGYRRCPATRHGAVCNNAHVAGGDDPRCPSCRRADRIERTENVLPMRRKGA